MKQDTSCVCFTILVAILLGGCAAQPTQYPLTEYGRSFNEMDESQAGSAPPVTAAVTGKRITTARAEPQN
jgi:hypothetical protein